VLDRGNRRRSPRTRRTAAANVLEWNPRQLRPVAYRQPTRQSLDGIVWHARRIRPTVPRLYPRARVITRERRGTPLGADARKSLIFHALARLVPRMPRMVTHARAAYSDLKSLSREGVPVRVRLRACCGSLFRPKSRRLDGSRTLVGASRWPESRARSAPRRTGASTLLGSAPVGRSDSRLERSASRRGAPAE
jgi:hypothetical protein